MLHLRSIASGYSVCREVGGLAKGRAFGKATVLDSGVIWPRAAMLSSAILNQSQSIYL